MDDFNVSSLHESKNEWGARLITLFTPLILEGLKSIFDESVKLCQENKEMDKYLMTFQNLITRIPKWNTVIVENERKRIIERSHCNYLEELVTCVHIIQLKLLTAMRVGQKQKKIEINVPKLDDFIHKCYINVARKVYKNVYLYEVNIPPLQVQKHNRELEIIVQECILNTIRESIPVENILKAYMDQTTEDEVVEEIKEQVIKESLPINATGETTYIPEEVPSIAPQGIVDTSANDIKENMSLKFNDMDNVIDGNGISNMIESSKDVERLDELSRLRHEQRKLEEEMEAASDKLNISDDMASLTEFDIKDLNEPLPTDLDISSLIDDIEILT